MKQEGRKEAFAAARFEVCPWDRHGFFRLSTFVGRIFGVGLLSAIFKDRRSVSDKIKNVLSVYHYLIVPAFILWACAKSVLGLGKFLYVTRTYLVRNLPCVAIFVSTPYPLECDTALSAEERATQLTKEDACHSQVAQSGNNKSELGTKLQRKLNFEGIKYWRNFGIRC